MECEEAGIQFPNAAAIAGEAVQGVPCHAVPAGGVQAGAVQGEQLGTAASCKLMYPVGEGLTFMGGCAFEELKQQAAWVAQHCALPEHAEAVVRGCGCVLAVLTVAVSVHSFHAAADACEVRVEAVWEVLITVV